MKRTNHNEENNQVVYPTPVLANMRGSRGVTFMEKKKLFSNFRDQGNIFWRVHTQKS